MKKFLKLVMILSMAFALCACSSNTEGSSTIQGTYSIYIDGYDWGCGTSKAIVTLNYALDTVTSTDFNVTETKQVTDFSDSTFPVKEVTVERVVTDAYLCDESGNKGTEASKYVALDLYCSPNHGSPLLYSMDTRYNTWSDPYYLTITLSSEANLTSMKEEVKEFTINTEFTAKTTATDVFKTDAYKTKDGVNYEYAYYTPEKDTDTLVVWLHDMGEGGTENTDVSVATLANKVTALVGEEFQSTINNATILVPQCPTFWMDMDGKGDINGGALSNTGPSFYTESLKELIDSYKEECGATKVVLAGCSNGGYMSLRLAIDYPDDFTAIVPICEALADEYITDKELEGIKDLPMFFIYSKDDTVVDPTKYEIPTIKRLQDMNASNVHVFTSETVVDTSGKYKDEDGNPYQYNGHWSWVYFDNNEADCDDSSIKVWDWIGEQLK